MSSKSNEIRNRVKSTKENRPLLTIPYQISKGETIEFIVLKPSSREVIQNKHEIAEALDSFKDSIDSNNNSIINKAIQENNFKDDETQRLVQIYEDTLNNVYEPLALKFIKDFKGVKFKHLIEFDFYQDYSEEQLEEDVEFDLLDVLLDNPDNYMMRNEIISKIVGLLLGKLLNDSDKKKRI